VTLVSELPDDEVVLREDNEYMSTVNPQMFVDDQEWRLYHYVEVNTGSVVKFYQLDNVENWSHSFLSCHTRASRRPGFYVYGMFLVMVMC
jgi:hypothetical protein